MEHGHTHEEVPMPPAPRSVRVALGCILIPLAIITLIAMIALWPGSSMPGQDTVVRIRGKIETATPACPPGQPAMPGGPCGTATVRVKRTTGDEVVNATVPSGRNAPEIAPGDRVVLQSSGRGDYAVVDHDRSSALLVLLALFAAAVITFARWRGFTSLIGLAVSFAVLLLFVLPAIQQGEAPLAVAVIGSAAIMFAVIYLTHGVSVSTSVAVLGTLASLILTGLLGLIVTDAMRLTGSGTEETAILSNVLSGVDLRGLLLAGIIIGTLGVLDDVTVTQTTIVNELSLADPTLSGRRLYASAIRVGRAHVASVVNTIILAYAGASLPLMLLFVVGGTPTIDVITSQAIAAEIVRSVVGTLGLIAAVPITTALASWISVKRRI